MKKYIYQSAFVLLAFIFISCASQAVQQPAPQPETRQAVISGTAAVSAWMTPDMKGKKPFRTVSPGEKINILKDTGKAALIEFSDGARAWVNSEAVAEK